MNGFPIQRIAVGYASTAIGPLSLAAKLYCWDDLTGNWFLADTKTMVAGTITWFDQPTLGNVPPVKDQLVSTAGCLDVALVVAAAGGDPAGIYTFAMGADVSSAP